MLRFDVNNGITLCRDHHNMTKGKESAYAPTLRRIIKCSM
jgi:hypothetical protein